MKDKYKISVGEPWDYENDIGKNIITGQILKRISNRCIVFMSDIHLEFGDSKGGILVLSDRYNLHDTSKELNGMTVNGGLLLTNFDDSLDEEELKKNCKFVIIGQLERI